jgi:tRNA(fMet)-specific endonuclease VapC
MICLDTNIVITAINRGAPQVRKRLVDELANGAIVGIPAIVLFELWYGIKKSARQRANAADLSDFLALDVTAWSFEPEDAEEAGDIRAALEHACTPIGAYDVLIAAQARRRKCHARYCEQARVFACTGPEDGRLGGLSHRLA